jgi:lipopolysaccharide/colanic/teichoic acid biosynthesis glycosyltransferase
MKRLFDIVASTLLLLTILPAFIVISAAIWICSRGPIFYGGRRVGWRGRPFTMWKFRTMIFDAEAVGPSSTADDDPRVTGIGRFLRRYKLDELPQLWNVWVGDMSMVGPRPQVEWAVNRYSADERAVLNVRPGITDPASLRFSNEGEILRGHADPDRAYFELIHPEKMRLSLDYVHSHSLLRDLQILVATAAAALGRRVEPEWSKSARRQNQQS